MTGNIRQGIALLLFAALVGIVGVATSGLENDLGPLLLLVAAAVAVIGLVRLIAELMRQD